MVDDFAIPRQSQPGQVFELAKLKFLAATIDVEIVNAQPNLVARGARVQPRDDRGPRVSQVQVATWRWCVPSSTHPASLPERHSGPGPKMSLRVVSA